MSYKNFKVWLVRFDGPSPVAILKTGLVDEVPALEQALETLLCVEKAQFEFERSIDRVRPQIRIELTEDAKSDPDGAWRKELVEFLKPVARRKAEVDKPEPIQDHEGCHVANELVVRFTYGEPPTNADALRIMRRPGVRHARMGLRHKMPALIIVLDSSVDVARFLEFLQTDLEVMLVR